MLWTLPLQCTLVSDDCLGLGSCQPGRNPHSGGVDTVTAIIYDANTLSGELCVDLTYLVCTMMARTKLNGD